MPPVCIEKVCYKKASIKKMLWICNRAPTLFLPQKFRISNEKKGDFLAISKENLARLRQKPILIKTIYGSFRVNGPFHADKIDLINLLHKVKLYTQ